MGYNKTRNSVVRNKMQLDHLLKSRKTLHFPTDAPTELAYKLREAIAAAGCFAEYKHYHELHRIYTFKEVDDGVLAVFIPVNIKPSEISDADVTQVTPSKAAPKKKIITDAITLIELLSAVMLWQGEYELVFPNVELSDEDRERLFEFVSDKPWQYIDHEDSGVTLTKNPDIPKEVLWAPQESQV